MIRSLVTLFALTLALPQVAYAECEQSEKVRLSGELKKLAQRNAWSGVERSYLSLLETKCDLSFDENQLGAESARYLGKTMQMYDRLAAAKELDPQPQILENLSGLDSMYGRVRVKGDARRRPVLSRAAMPFAPDERKSIEWAIEVVAGTGSFEGMLPNGEYLVGEIAFTVESGEEWQEVVVGKVKGGGGNVSGGSGPSDSEGAINWAGLIATAGPNFIMPPEPGNPVLDSSGMHQFEPADVFAGGLQIQLGGELGLTYKAPEAGLALTIGYSGGFGNDTFHQMTGWFAGVLRPGELRIAVGPTYNVITGKGTGVAQWFDVGQDKAADPVNSLRYEGWSWGGGAQASVGYGLVDLGDSMKGIVELGGGWATDGSRSFSGFGLRLGIVPSVPRFGG